MSTPIDLSHRPEKVQLGARVARLVREAAVTRAKSEGVSLNVWVERTLAAALSRDGASPASDAHGSPVKATPATSQRAPVPMSADGHRLWPCPRAQCRQMGIAGERCPIDTHLTFKEVR